MLRQDSKEAYREHDVRRKYPGELRQAPRERHALRSQLSRHDLVRLIAEMPEKLCQRLRESGFWTHETWKRPIGYICIDPGTCCITVFTENVTKNRPIMEITTTAVVESAKFRYSN